jgi:trk system potassium uptake protein TrkA
VVARLNDPRRAEIYRRLGLVTISMVSWGAQRINDLLIHTNLEPTIYFGRGEVSLVAIEIPSHLVGRQVTHITIPGEISVVAINREGEAIMTTLGTEFHKDDLVYFAVQTSAMDRLESMLGV